MAEQTAVNWMIEELLKRHNSTLGSEYVKIFNQAKEIEKQQIIDAYKNGQQIVEQYYNETYGSKGSEEIEKSELPIIPEISDEEIEKAAKIFWPKADESSLIRCWILGAKWYREQLKQQRQ